MPSDLDLFTALSAVEAKIHQERWKIPVVAPVERLTVDLRTTLETSLRRQVATQTILGS